MPINNGVFCNQIPLPWGKKKAFLWIQLTAFALSLGFPRSDAAADCLCTKGHIYMLLISPRCSAMTQTVIKGTCPGTVMWPFHLYCRILSASVGPNRTNSWWSVSCDNKITAVVDDVMGVCVASLSFTEPHNQKASKYFLTIVFLCKYVLDGVLDRWACVSHYLQYLTHDVLKLLKKLYYS